MQKYEENYYRACALILKHGAKSKRTLLNHHLSSSGQSLYQFIEENGHDLLHLHVGKKQCCRCKILPNYVPPNVKTLCPAQMQVLFCKNGYLKEHTGVLSHAYCCRYPNRTIKVEDLDISLLNILFSNFCNDLFWESCINGQTLEIFLNSKKHSLYHLWRLKEPCCFNKCTSVMKSKTRRIQKSQWDTLFLLTINPLTCKDGKACSCSYQAIFGIKVVDIENDLAREILHSTSPLKQAVEGIVALRNTYFAHVKDNSLSDMQLKDTLQKCEDYMKTIAIACKSGPEAITEIIENVKDMTLDESMCVQLNKVLLSQILEKTTINKYFKSNNRKLQSIDEKNIRFLELGQDIKEENRRILENQTKLLQQNEQILAILNGEKWYENVFSKVTCFFASSLSVLGSWLISPNSSSSAENDGDDEKELYRFTCEKCRIDFTILEEFLKHKQEVHDKKPRHRVRTTITGADNTWERDVMDSTRNNIRSLDVESFETEKARSGSLIFVAKISSAVVASKDKIMVVIKAFLINLFKRCSLPSIDLKIIEIKVEVYESFSDEEDGEECDTYYCGRCEKEYKSLGSFLLHTESQEHKLNKTNLKETKPFTEPTNALTEGPQNKPTHIESQKPKEAFPASESQPFPVPDEPNINEEYTVPNLPAILTTSEAEGPQSKQTHIESPKPKDPLPANVPQPFPVHDSPSIIKPDTVLNSPAKQTTSQKERLVEKISEIDCSDVKHTKVHKPNRNISDLNDAYQSDSRNISSGYETGNSTEPNKEDTKQVRKKYQIGIQEDSGLSEFSEIEESKPFRENQSTINKQKMKSCTNKSVPLLSEIESGVTADVDMIAKMTDDIAVTVSPCTHILETDVVQQKPFHGKTRKRQSARQRRKNKIKKLSTPAEVHYRDEITIDFHWANEEDYYIEFDQSQNISDDDFSLYSGDDNDLTHSTKGGLSEDGVGNIEIKKNKGNYYEKSKQLHAQERRKSFVDTQMLQYGLELSEKCLYELKHKLRRHAKKYEQFYTPLVQDKASLQIKYEQNPTIYRKAKLQIISSHTAVCTLNEPYNGIDTVEISGRSKCGKAYTDDEVLIEIFQEKGHTHHIKRMNKNINTTENLFGQVIGLFNRNRYDRIDHPVLVCELDKYEYDKAKPVCKTLPKFHLLTENTEDRPNPFSVDIYDYNEKTKRITHNRSLQVSPALRQKYLFYIAYISWESLYPLGAIIKVHKSTDDLISALHILELQYKVPTLYTRETIKEADRILSLRSLDNKQNRYDLTTLCNTFTIDPMNSEVLDDAVSIDKLRNGGYRVGVHITDASSFVDIDSALDEEARQRGTTFFRGQFGDPHQMLPEPISIKCSLKEGKSRLAFSIFFHFDETFKYIKADTKCCKSVIASRSQITYAQVQDIITNQAENKFKTGILTLFEISKSLRKRRLGNGMASINYEQDVFEDEENSTNFPEAFYLIEEIMILTNHSVATYLLQKFPNCVPLRCQDPPLSTKFKEWRKAYPKISDLILRLQGYPKTLDMKTKIDIDVFDKPDGPKLRCNDIICVQKWLWSSMADCLNNRETTKAAEWLRKEDLHPFHALAIQKWKSIQMFAEYRCSGMFTGSKIKHFSLGIFPYTHFTSPVRRYIDIVVHRLLHAAIDGNSPPYSCEDVHSICQDMNKIAKEAKDYGNHCKSLLLADKLKTSPLTVHAFVDECNEKELSLLIPGCSYLNKHCTLLKLNLLGVYERPKFKADRDKPNSEAGRQYVILTWKDRIYSTSGRRPFPKSPKDGYHVMPKGQPQKINPHQKTEFKQMSVWIECIKGLVINYDPSNMLPRINFDPYDTIAASFLHLSGNTENDVNSEVKHIRDPKSKRQNTETAFITEQYCSYSMNFHHGQVIAVQLSSEIQKGILTPYIQLVDMTQNLKYCLQHMQDPVGTLEEYSTTSTKLRYDDSNHYKSVWIPIILMETAMSVVRDDAIVINNIMVSINENNGYFILRSDFCFERNIDFGGKPVYFKEEEDDDDDTEENENQVFQSEDYLCIKCPVSTQTNEYMRVRKTTAPKEYNIWTNHAKTTKVNKTRKNTPEEKLRIHFRFIKDRPLPSTQRIMCSVEIMQKPEIDKRVEVLVGHINRSTLLAKAIALNRKVPTLDENHLEAIKAKDVDIGLPANNKQQEKAILISLRSTFSLIHGPPGTGKTNMGIKLVCLFKEINERVKSEEEDKKQIVYCGPSNKSVDLVAARLLQLSRHSENTPKIARLYGSSIEILDYPLPGRVSSTSKNTRDSKSDERLKDVTIHHLIRSHGNPHAEEIKALFLDIVQTQTHIAAGITIWPFLNPINALKEELNELPDDKDETNEGEVEEEDKEHKSIMDKIKQYNKLVQEATIEELKKYDVIFCTTAMATNSRLLKGMEGRIYQVIIDECGMCTEPECISTIIATKAKQVVLIGDHKQLRPVVVCPQARQLGLQRSLFERYHNDKNVVQLTVQYRMHPSICEFPSRKFYNDKLITDEKSKSYVETRPLKVWFSEEKRTVFCHVEGEEEILPVSTEEGNEMSRRNQAEVDLVIKIYRHLHNNERIFESKGQDKKLTINIMSQYKDQCAAMRSALEKVGFKNVNVNTVVSSQGGEWDYVIFSLVRSLPDYRIEKSPTRGWCSQNLGFITDEHQINVALTRAKKGLFLIGNKHLLKCDEVWKDLIQTYDRKGCVVNGVAYPPPYHQIVKKKKHIKPKHTEIDDDGFQKV